MHNTQSGPLQCSHAATDSGTCKPCMLQAAAAGVLAATATHQDVRRQRQTCPPIMQADHQCVSLQENTTQPSLRCRGGTGVTQPNTTPGRTTRCFTRADKPAHSFIPQAQRAAGDCSAGPTTTALSAAQLTIRMQPKQTALSTQATPPCQSTWGPHMPCLLAPIYCTNRSLQPVALNPTAADFESATQPAVDRPWQHCSLKPACPSRCHPRRHPGCRPHCT